MNKFKRTGMYQKFNIEETVDKFATQKTSENYQKLRHIVEEIIEDREKIIDLFCKTFLAVQENPTTKSLLNLFSMIELECTMHDNLRQTYRIKLIQQMPKGKENETM